jgi:hypothetical protein
MCSLILQTRIVGALIARMYVPIGLGGFISLFAVSAKLRLFSQIVGMFPPSMTYSLPVIDEARPETRNATNSATS